MRCINALVLVCLVCACDRSAKDEASGDSPNPPLPGQSAEEATGGTAAVPPELPPNAGANTSGGGPPAPLPTAAAPQVGGSPNAEPAAPAPEPSVPAEEPAPGVQQRLGLQLYSLRAQLAEDLAGTLTLVKKMGFDRIEAYDLHGQTAAGLRQMLDERQLTVGGFSAAYERIETDPAGVVSDAKTLGAPVVSCAWIPHTGTYTRENNLRAIEVFTKIGNLAKTEGLRFVYHPHGYEFYPGGIGERLIDQMIQQTEPGIVDFEMDVFWVTHGGGDPVAYLERYPKRFPLFHLKDMKSGTPTGLTTGSAPENSNVQLGTGVINFPAIIRAAEKTQESPVYFVEDESDSVVDTLPESLKYLQAIELP